MLSIGKAQGNYYADLAKDDYYNSKAEKAGLWHGEGAKALGLNGNVQREEFLKLCDGFDKNDNALVQNAGQETHRTGWDLCFSAPKSVSVLWSQADDKTRNLIEEAHLEAVKKGLDYIEEKGCWTRRGHQGVEAEKAKFVIAIYEHGTSREQDPELHSHSVVLNLAVREDGTTGTIESQKLYSLQMSGGAIYRAELAEQLQEKLGVEIEKTKVAFEIKGVSKELCREFSKRREAIENAMKDANAFGADRAEYFALNTRNKKENIDKDLLFEKWQAVGKDYGFNQAYILGKNQRAINKEYEKHLSVHKAVSEITFSQSYFTENQLTRKTAEEGLGKLNADEVRQAVKKYLENEAVNLGKGFNGNSKIRDSFYTTNEILNLEKKMLRQVSELKNKPFLATDGKSVKVNPLLNNEQRQALFSITDNSKSINVVSGMAGTGKTTILQNAKSVWESQGFNVRGVALAGKASKGLEEGAGITSDTIHKTLFELEKGRLKFDEKTILVCDEAGMVGTRQMSELVNEVSKANAKIVLVGDEKQLQPIEHGNPFNAIGNRIGRSELTEIIRQKDLWARQAVTHFANGEADKGLQAYAERGLLKIADSRDEAMKELVKTWHSEKQNDLKTSIILAGTKAEVSKLNRYCQAMRINNNELKEKTVSTQNGKIFENDRVLFTKNNRIYKVNNGDLGTVTEVSSLKREIKVELDSGKNVIIPLTKYEEVQLGYAVTTHKAQGVTIDKAYILAGGIMQDRELSYVQMSRSRVETKIFIDKGEEGQTIKELAKNMSRSRQKEIALDVLENKQNSRVEITR